MKVAQSSWIRAEIAAQQLSAARAPSISGLIVTDVYNYSSN